MQDVRLVQPTRLRRRLVLVAETKGIFVPQKVSSIRIQIPSKYHEFPNGNLNIKQNDTLKQLQRQQLQPLQQLQQPHHHQRLQQYHRVHQVHCQQEPDVNCHFKLPFI